MPHCALPCHNLAISTNCRLGLRHYLLLLVLNPLLAVSALAAPRTDVVVLLNGDRLTGEVKELVQGKLEFKTDTAGTLYIEWDKVASLQSQQRLQVELGSGERHFGSAVAAADSGQLTLNDESHTTAVSLPLIEITQIYPIDQGNRIITQLDGYLTAGYNYTKANNIQDFVFTGGLSTTQEKRQWSLDASTAVTTQDGANDTQRFDIAGRMRRFLPRRWFWQSTLQFESNEELGLNLRTSAGGAYGTYLVQNHEHEWAAYLGANVTNEREVAVPNRQDIEALIGTQYAFFHYDTPERTIYADLDVLPSLTDSGRVRVGAKVRCRYEIVKDFFFELSMYGTYDSRPGENARSNSDYGTETSLGFTF